MNPADECRRLLWRPMDVEWHECTDSTNRIAREKGMAGHGDCLIIARSQTAGRGRMGRSFLSPEGGLYFSFLFHPEGSASESLSITVAAAVAAARAIDLLAGGQSQIKWVNDIYRGGRKVCGILTEAKLGAGGRVCYAVLGIGVNLIPPSGGFAPEIADRAGALFPPGTDTSAIRPSLAAAIVNEFERIRQTGEDFLSEYRERSLLPGREILVLRPDGQEIPAVAEGIGDDFSLLVRYADGRREALSSGDVSIRL